MRSEEEIREKIEELRRRIKERKPGFLDWLFYTDERENYIVALEWVLGKRKKL